METNDITFDWFVYIIKKPLRS